MNRLHTTGMALLLTMGSLSCYAQAPQAAAGAKTSDCAIADLKTNPELTQKLNVGDDPIGLVYEPKDPNGQVRPVLQAYADKHQCSIYVLSMKELVDGLMQGNSLPNSGGEGQQEGKNPPPPKGMSDKYLVIQPKKYVCMKELGLKLPAKAISPGAQTPSEEKPATPASK